MIITYHYPHSHQTNQLDIKSSFASEDNILLLVNDFRVNELRMYGMAAYDKFMGFYPTFNKLPREMRELEVAPLGHKVMLQDKYDKETGWKLSEYMKVKNDQVFDLIKEYKLYLHVIKTPEDNIIVFNSKLPIKYGL